MVYKFEDGQIIIFMSKDRITTNIIHRDVDIAKEVGDYILLAICQHGVKAFDIINDRINNMRFK